ncbi:MAG: hypothetical protein ACTSP3_12730, partial [Candidatus Heimdallarchaeaceae archaeon]
LSQRGMALGALGFYVSFSRSISTLTLTPIWEKYGINYVFVSTAIITATLTIGIFLIFSRLKRKIKLTIAERGEMTTVCTNKER